MTREKQLEQIIKDTFWMARRYAHGRHTTDPSTVREAYNKLVRLGIEIKDDVTITKPVHGFRGMDFRGDYLDDLIVKQ